MAKRRMNLRPRRSAAAATRARPLGKITKPPPTQEMVEERARELAAIAGRDANRPTASDRREAKRELREAIHPTIRTRDVAQLDAAQWDMTPTSSGRRTRRRRPRDDETTKQTVEEGVDEAEHSEMLEAAKSRTRNTG